VGLWVLASSLEFLLSLVFGAFGAHSFSFSEAEEQKVSPQFTGSFTVTEVSLM
jgi:hypothetical protein